MPQFSRTDRLPSTLSPRRAVIPIPIAPQNSKKFSLRSIAVDGCVALQMNHSARAKAMKPITTANNQKIRRPKWEGIIDADATTGYFRISAFREFCGGDTNGNRGSLAPPAPPAVGPHGASLGMTTRVYGWWWIVGLPESLGERYEVAGPGKFVRFCASSLPIVAIVAMWAIEGSATYLFSITP